MKGGRCVSQSEGTLSTFFIIRTSVMDSRWREPEGERSITHTSRSGVFPLQAVRHQLHSVIHYFHIISFHFFSFAVVGRFLVRSVSPLLLVFFLFPPKDSFRFAASRSSLPSNRYTTEIKSHICRNNPRFFPAPHTDTARHTHTLLFTSSRRVDALSSTILMIQPLALRYISSSLTRQSGLGGRPKGKKLQYLHKNDHPVCALQMKKESFSRCFSLSFDFIRRFVHSFINKLSRLQLTAAVIS